MSKSFCLKGVRLYFSQCSPTVTMNTPQGKMWRCCKCTNQKRPLKGLEPPQSLLQTFNMSPSASWLGLLGLCLKATARFCTKPTIHEWTGQSESLAARTEQSSTTVCSIKVPGAAALRKVLLPLFWTQLSQKLSQGGASLVCLFVCFILAFFGAFSGFFLKLFLLKVISNRRWFGFGEAVT